MKRLLTPALLALAAPLLAQTALPPLPAASAEWGAPLAQPAARAPSGPVTITLPKSPPSAFAAARASAQATGDYFHDFGKLIVRVRSVK